MPCVYPHNMKRTIAENSGRHERDWRLQLPPTTGGTMPVCSRLSDLSVKGALKSVADSWLIMFSD